MARPAVGQVVVRQRKTVRVFALRFRAYGKREYVTLGTDADGWTAQRAEVELQNVLADVRRGVWRPPRPELAPPPATDPTFHEFASQWFEANEGAWSTNTRLDYRWQLTDHLLPFFDQHRLSQITIAEVDRYRAAKVRQGTLSPASINKTLGRLSQILEIAVEYGMLDRNPAAGRRRRLKASKPRPVHVDTAEHLAALLEAAGELDKSSQTGGRRAALAVMLFGGLRADEVGRLRWRDVDLANGRLTVGRSKTPTGVRDVDLVPILRDELLTLKARTRGRPDAPVIVTSTGRPRDRHNLRQRVVPPIVAGADKLLIARDARPLPLGLSPHKLRHTFASILVALGNDPAYVMAQLGHTSPNFTLRVYTHMMRREPGERDRLRALVEGEFAGLADDVQAARNIDELQDHAGYASKSGVPRP